MRAFPPATTACVGPADAIAMFLDSDAQVTPGALQTVVGILDADPRIGLVGPRLVYPDGRPQPSARRFPPPLLPLLRRPPLDRWFADSPPSVTT